MTLRFPRRPSRTSAHAPRTPRAALAALLALLSPAHALATEPAPRDQVVDAASLVPDLQVEIKYSTPDNFLHRDVYGALEVCILQQDAAEMLAAAATALRAAHPELRLHVYDCARPYRVQLAMWALVKGTPQQGYVADPTNGGSSVHNHGCAVDLTLATAGGAPLDMGTPFDHFGVEAQPRAERELLLAGTLTHTQVANRLILREAMLRAGFYPLDNEWWHFDCAPPAEARTRYPRLP